MSEVILKLCIQPFYSLNKLVIIKKATIIKIKLIPIWHTPTPDIVCILAF